VDFFFRVHNFTLCLKNNKHSWNFDLPQEVKSKKKLFFSLVFVFEKAGFGVFKKIWQLKAAKNWRGL
jgi:hypothetical protein